ncbi:MAG: cell division protein FtsQ/DivIB [Prevotellaceae bacterium]|jgi:cell division protein FtsQ|nr:cell division protein FtsQ/DivIB [Prevotellaceae bacterium]
MNIKQKITLAITAALFLAYLTVTAGFVNRERRHIYCHSIKVTVCDSSLLRFVSAKEVRRLIEKDNPHIIGTAIDSIDLRRLEEKLNARSVVKNAEIFTSIDGTLHARVHQRRPIVRVLAETGSFYIDDGGYIFPFSPAYTPYVPVVTGNVAVSFKNSYRGGIPAKDKLLQQLYTFSRFLQQHRFWQSQILQIHVQNRNDIELIPRVGRQLIKLGPLDNFEYKLTKLYAFYRNAMPQEGWDKYIKLDLRYSNQVVATREPGIKN